MASARRTRLDRELERLWTRIEAIPERAAVQGLNRAATRAITDWSRGIRSKYAMRARAVRKRIGIRRARRGRLRAELIAGRFQLRVAEFRPRQTRRGVSVRIRKGVTTRLSGQFIARTRGGYTGVFGRTSSARLPLREQEAFLFSDAAAEALTPDVRRAIEKRVHDEVERAVTFQLGRLR